MTSKKPGDGLVDTGSAHASAGTTFQNPMLIFFERHSEAIFAVFIAISTVLFAIREMYYSRYEAIIATQTTEKNNSYLWYQSKSPRESLGSHQKELIQAFLSSGLLLRPQCPRLRPLTSSLERIGAS